VNGLDTPEWVSQIQIRNAEERDLPALEWEGEFIHYRRLYSQIFQTTREGRALIWIAEWGEVGLIGQVFVQLASERFDLADGNKLAYIYGFRVKSAYRNVGVGSKILGFIEDDLFRRLYERATLNVAQTNRLALQFYLRHGYKIIGTEPGQWAYIDHLGVRREVNEPAWRMEKLLLG
jgi:ribosomal protein S18 acetylase RimI-like enzyme